MTVGRDQLFVNNRVKSADKSKYTLYDGNWSLFSWYNFKNTFNFILRPYFESRMRQIADISVKIQLNFMGQKNCISPYGRNGYYHRKNSTFR